jgi:hypothetical protein
MPTHSETRRTDHAHLVGHETAATHPSRPMCATSMSKPRCSKSASTTFASSNAATGRQPSVRCGQQRPTPNPTNTTTPSEICKPKPRACCPSLMPPDDSPDRRPQLTDRPARNRRLDRPNAIGPQPVQPARKDHDAMALQPLARTPLRDARDMPDMARASRWRWRRSVSALCTGWVDEASAWRNPSHHAGR